MIIRAFEELKDDRIGLLLLGNGELYDELKKHETENLKMPGFKSNIYDYLKASDYYISASDVEGLANTLLESMTVGLPCVLSDIPSHKEVLSKAEQTIGYTFNNKDMNGLKNAMHSILEIDEVCVRTQIQSLFQKYYTAQKMSESYQKAYIGLLST